MANKLACPTVRAHSLITCKRQVLAGAREPLGQREHAAITFICVFRSGNLSIKSHSGVGLQVVLAPHL